MLPEDRSRELENLAAQLLATSNQLTASIHPILRKTLGGLVRSMNCYYSNLIEGHHTHPVDINRALAGDYSAEPEKRNLQLEAVAHIEVQRRIDSGVAPYPATSTEFISYVHRTFCELLPNELLWVENPDTHERLPVIPGEFRTRHVKVGHHIPPPADEIGDMLGRFSAVYGGRALGTLGRIVASGAAHHRLLWIHPFLDGNGRVARLFSHAFLRELGIGCEFWRNGRRARPHLSVTRVPPTRLPGMMQNLKVSASYPRNAMSSAQVGPPRSAKFTSSLGGLSKNTGFFTSQFKSLFSRQPR